MDRRDRTHEEVEIGANLSLKIILNNGNIYVVNAHSSNDPEYSYCISSRFSPKDYISGIMGLIKDGKCDIPHNSEVLGSRLKVDKGKDGRLDISFGGFSWSYQAAPEDFIAFRNLGVDCQATAPVRIDLAGGTTDIAQFVEQEKEGGATINAAISHYARASLMSNMMRGIFVMTHDRKERFYGANLPELKYDGNLDLIKAILRHFTKSPADMIIEAGSDAPLGSGLGGSAAASIAFIGLLSYITQESLSKKECAELAYRLENEELHILGGKQDQYAAAFGGINLFRFYPGRVERLPVDLTKDEAKHLQDRLVLCYTGQSRLSGDANAKMIGNYRNGTGNARECLRGIRDIALQVYSALIERRFDDLPDLLNHETELRVQLHPEIGEGVDGNYGKIRRQGLENGASAAKIMGAGAGGCLLFYAEPEKRNGLERALGSMGAKVIPVHFDYSGLVVK